MTRRAVRIMFAMHATQTVARLFVRPVPASETRPRKPFQPENFFSTDSVRALLYSVCRVEKLAMKRRGDEARGNLRGIERNR